MGRCLWVSITIVIIISTSLIRLAVSDISIGSQKSSGRSRSDNSGNGDTKGEPQSLVNLNDKTDSEDQSKGFIKVAKKLANLTGYVDGKVSLFCDISGKPPPKLSWKKGRLLLTDISMKLAIKEEVWGGLLKINDLDFSDEGWYLCIGENEYGSVNTSAYLKVVKPKTTSKKTKDSNGLFPTKDEKGFCQTFQSSTCGQYLSGHRVYVTGGLAQSEKERRIASLVAEISSVLSGQADQECLRHLMRLTCHHHFQICNQDNNPRKLCRSDCLDVAKKRCNYTYKQMLKKLRTKHLDSVPICSELKDDPGCFRFDEILPESSLSDNDKNGKTRKNGNGNSNTDNQLPQIPELECYNGTGADYNGHMSTTVKGKICLNWNEVPGYEKYDQKNYCRSPILDTIHATIGPWCFTSIKGEWEMCPIPKCTDQATLNLKTNNHLLPIYIAVSGVIGFVFLLIIVCWICRRSYFGLYKPCHGGDFKKPDNHVMQLNKMKINCTEYPLSQIRFQEQIGEGIFGPVYKAELVVNGVVNGGVCSNSNSSSNNTATNNGLCSTHQSVIVKTLSAGSSLNLQRDFKREAQMMTELRHVNVLALVGVSMRQIPWCLIFEGNGNGGQDLHELLVSCSNNITMSNIEARSVSTGPPDSMDAYGDVSLSYSDQIFIATQIASGMEYLSSHCFVHRDLAARNVLVSSTEHLQCRICDVGLVRERYSADYYRAPGSNLMLPIRWMPPEAVSHGSFTRESDVWSFGVLLWELWSAGLQPFYGHSNAEVIDLVRARQILPQPESCPNRVYELMLECWNELPRHRPLFRNIHARLRLWQQEAISPCGANMVALLGNGGLGSSTNPTTASYNGMNSNLMNGMIGGGGGGGSGSHSGGSHSRHTTSSTEMCSDHSHLLSGINGGGGGNNGYSPSPPKQPMDMAVHCPFTNSPPPLMQHTTQYDQPPLPPPSLIQLQQQQFPQSRIPPHTSTVSTTTTTSNINNNNNNNYLPELSHIV